MNNAMKLVLPKLGMLAAALVLGGVAVAITAPSAWRAIFPVSSVSVSCPHSMDFLTTLNISLPYVIGRRPLPDIRAMRRYPQTPLRDR